MKKEDKLSATDEVVYMTVPVKSNSDEIDIKILLKHMRQGIDIKYTCGKTLWEGMENDIKDYFITLNVTKLKKHLSEGEYNLRYKGWVEKYTTEKNMYHSDF